MICEEMIEIKELPIVNQQIPNVILQSTFKKKLSRVSLALEKSLNQDRSRGTKDITSISEATDPVFMVYITVNLVIENGIKSISFIMNNSSKIESIIPKAIYLFNAMFREEQTLFRLKEDRELYALKPSKKTGYPKLDIPNINGQTSLMESTYTQFSLVVNSNPEDHHIYFVKTKAVKPKNNSNRCSLL